MTDHEHVCVHCELCKTYLWQCECVGLAAIGKEQILRGFCKRCDDAQKPPELKGQ